MTEKYSVTPEQTQALKDLEKGIGKTIPIVKEIKYNTFGVNIEGDKVIGICINKQGLKTLPDSIGNLSSLQKLWINDNQLTVLPDSIGKLESLKELTLYRTKLKTLPDSIGKLKSLQTLNLEKNNLSDLPESIGNLSSLELIILKSNNLSTLPDSIGNLSSLKELNLEANKLSTLPDSIVRLSSLEKLDLSRNEFTTLPEYIGNISSLKSLKVEGKSHVSWRDRMDQMVSEAGGVVPPPKPKKSPEEKALDKNHLSTLPDSIGKLKSLQTLNLRSNNLSDLPESIGNLSSLKELDLSENDFYTFPESIGKLKSLQRLVFQRNQLSILPNCISNLTSLKTLLINRNFQLTTLPDSFWRLKNLTRLFLTKNVWKGAWKGIEHDTISRVLELCRQIAPIIVFIGHSQKDGEEYRINDLKQDLKERPEIRDVLTSGEQGSLESQLFLFIATKNSINNDRCLQELDLAIKHDIPIVPIKGTDVTFEELSQVDLGADFNLSDKLGLSFDIENFEKFRDELYVHITKYKREVNLMEPEERKIDEQWLNIKNIGEKFVESQEFREKYMENINKFNKLSEELKTEHISPGEYIFKTGQIFKLKLK